MQPGPGVSQTAGMCLGPLRPLVHSVRVVCAAAAVRVPEAVCCGEEHASFLPSLPPRQVLPRRHDAAAHTR